MNNYNISKMENNTGSNSIQNNIETLENNSKIEEYLHLEIPPDANETKISEKLNPNQKNQLEVVINTLKQYYTKPPSTKILPYLFLTLISYEELKQNFKLKINPEFIENVGFRDWNSFEAGYIYYGFGWKTQKNYIVNLAYQEEYFNFFSENDRKNLTSHYNEYTPGLEEKIDVVNRTKTLQAITKKNSDFPFDDLIYSLGLFD